MIKNSPRFAEASMSIIELMREVNNFPTHILPMIGDHITDIQPGDHVQEQVPTFIQQMDALYAEKGSRMHDANEQGDFAKAHRLFNEHSLLHSMLTYFASVAAPLEWIDVPFSWHIRKDFVLVYRKSEAKNGDDIDEDEDEQAPKPTKPKRVLN